MIALFVGHADLERALAALWGTTTVPPRIVDPHPISHPKVRRAAWLGKLALCIGVSLIHIRTCLYIMTVAGELAPPSPLHAVHRVVAFTRDGQTTVPDQLRWLRLGINQEGAATIQFADGSGAWYMLNIDEAKRTMHFHHQGNPGFTLDYEQPADGQLRLSGTALGVPITADLQRVAHDPLLTRERFHMLQDYHVYVDPGR